MVEVTPPGHDLSRWAPARATALRLDLATLARRLAVEPGAALVVLAAHPDDETLGLGRLMHVWAQSLGPVTAIVATAGEACVDHVGRRPDDLVARRLAEWRNATAILGVAHRRTLGLPDGSLSDRIGDLESALEGILPDLVEQRASGVRGAGPTNTVLAAPWPSDPHPDHRAAGRAATAVGGRLRIPVLEFGVWMTYWSDPEELAADGRRLGVLSVDTDADDAYRRACAAFVTQLEPLLPGLGPVVPQAMLAHHHEQLLVLRAESVAGGPAVGRSPR